MMECGRAGVGFLNRLSPMILVLSLILVTDPELEWIEK
jgi:hypothetical protein